MRVMLVIGARPQIIKSASIVHKAASDDEIEFQIVHTGQHYDFEMSKVFFDELDLPDPVANLGIGSGSHAWQTGRMLIGLEDAVENLSPDFVLAPGDTNSTLAGALAAIKLHVPVAHVEAGARSNDMKMPEEVNRRLTDHCSTILFAATENCRKNLMNEGISESRIHVSGDTMFDIMQKHAKARTSHALKGLNLETERYAVITTHRPENVDNPEALRHIIDAITHLKELKIIFPIHPRTQERLKGFDLLEDLEKAGHVEIIDPVGYQDMLHLVKGAQILLTDSGGLQKEAFWLFTPCITLRKRTEWIETVKLGANRLVGSDKDAIIHEVRKCLAAKNPKRRLEELPNPFGDGNAATRVIKVLKEAC